VAQGFHTHAQKERRRGAAALARAWPEPAAGWMGEEAGQPQDRYSAAREREREATIVEEKATEEDEGEWGQPRPGPSYL
jgi:hypothetical protein